MIYEIPDTKLQKLEKQCNRIRNKGVTVIFDVLEPCQIKAFNNNKVTTPGHKVYVEGQYIINGWEFVATIEHTEKGNIIRCINDLYEKDIPEKYKTCPQECEHCHKKIGRKDTYLVYNKEKDDWKQVGKTCLQSYTGGLDADTCAQIASFFEVCDEKFEDDFFYGFDDNKYINAELFKRYAYVFIKDRGYNKESTVDSALDAMFGRGDYARGAEKPDPAKIEAIKEIDEWVNSLELADYGYMRNAQLAWAKEYIEYRDLALVASFIGVYFREKAKKAKEDENRANTNYVGSVGDKIEINVKSIRVLYLKDNSVYSYYATASKVYEIIDNNGNTYICDTTNSDIYQAEIIRATIKGYKEYRGIKQTVITRPKIVKYKPEENTDDKKASFIEAIRDLKFLDK